MIACDLDAAFLERCRETVAQFGFPSRLATVHVADGHTLDLPDDGADVVFSYITLQHCADDDALGLTREAVRVTKPGGTDRPELPHVGGRRRAAVAGRQGGARARGRCPASASCCRAGGGPPGSAGRPTA